MINILSEKLRELELVMVPNERRNRTGTPTLLLLAHLSMGKKRILEIGTGGGESAINMAKFSDEYAKVYTVDKEQYWDKEELRKHPGFDKIHFIEGDSQEINFMDLKEKFDLVFIDGDHSIKGVIADTATAVSVLTPGGIIAWHDVHSPNIITAIVHSGLQFTMWGPIGICRSGDRVHSKEVVSSLLVHFKKELEEIL